ncbi:cell division protein FtsX [Roseococcus sp. SDR]|uniref:cell division protein FtsX n=1 Tax=Roseococcus sp. SDR TaxID=2835532 RepID=UPI001BCCB437|nr:FtsX-like permease family protein [Roseococcus sp. SDR]MBS7791053.1 cell division protein FtsX [Roseococcus sp. SDR]MBV1846367.1 cell division protein FtsX [Roseococcus sp. SDR]
MAEGRRLKGRDPLGLRRALADRLLPALVAAMALLAALAIAGADGAGRLAERWQQGEAGQLLLQLPRETAPETVIARLEALPGVTSVTAVPDERLRQLLAPWLGEVPSLPLPRMLAITLPGGADHQPLLEAVQAIPGAQLELRSEAVRLAMRLADGLRGLSLAMLGLIGLVGAALVAVATRAGIAARRETIVILHELGARDADIAGRFARRLGWLCFLGALLGLAIALPALWFLAMQALPVVLARDAQITDLPWPLLALVPPTAATIGWLTALITLRAWLRRLP